MIGIIMAGGQGTRLYPLTANKPKPMVEVLGKPVIEYVKDAMVNSGINEIILTTGYKGESLENLVDSWNSMTGIQASVNRENTPMGTAGSVKLLESKLDGTFIVGSGDSILSSNLNRLIDAHRKSKAKVTMALWEVEDPTQFGIVGLSKEIGGPLYSSLSEGYICKFMEKPSKSEAFSNVINAGLYIIESEVLEYIPKNSKYDFSKELFPKILAMGLPMYAIKLDGVWFDVGTPLELIRAQNYLVERQEELPFDVAEGVHVENSGYIFKGAVTESPIYSSVLCEGVSVGQNSRIENTLVMRNTIVGDSTTIIETVLGVDVSVGDDCTLIRCVVGDSAKIPSGSNFTDLQIALN